MDEVSSQGTWFRFGRTVFRLFHLILLNPSCGGYCVDLGEKQEPRETAYVYCRKQNISEEGA